MSRKSLQDPMKLTAREELDVRIDFVGSLLARAYRNSEIKAEFRKRFGTYTGRTIDRYVSRAKRKALHASKIPREDWVARSLSTYNDIIRDPKAPHAAKVKAQERIDTVLGLDAAKKVEMAGPNGGPIQIDQLITASGITEDEIRGFIASAAPEAPRLTNDRDGIIEGQHATQA